MNDTNITRIVLTGGPCAGKTSCLALLRRELSAQGFYVVTVPEGARDFLQAGLTPHRMEKDGSWTFQEELLLYNLEREDRFIHAALRSREDRIILLYDRGIIDAKAYMEPYFFNLLVESTKMRWESLRDGRYDAVIHLRTAALGAEAFYACDSERHETPEEARSVDQRILNAWTGHPHLAIVDNSTDFATKKQRVLQEVCRFLGVPVPIEIERKYVVTKPDLTLLPEGHQAILITQTYLKRLDPAVERRVRCWEQNDTATYFLTTKKSRGQGTLERIEEERQISREEYAKLIAEADPQRRTIAKWRHCFVYENQYFELDDLTSVRPGLFVLEIELTTKQQAVALPPFLNVIREVTDDPAYTNSQLALIP